MDWVPAEVVVTGASMAPGLRPGWRLRVAPLDEEPAPGDVVLLRSGATTRAASGRSSASLGPGLAAPAFVVHRVVWMADLGGRRVVFHRGDAGGRVGVTRGDAVVGRVVGVLAAPASAASAHGASERTVPSLDALDAAQRRAFARAQRHCRVYVALRHAAARVGLPRARERTSVVARAAALVRRLLLRA